MGSKSAEKQVRVSQRKRMRNKSIRSQNKTVGYFKPIGPLPVHVDGVRTDEDAVFFKKILGLDDSLETLCPFVLSDETLTDIMRGAKHHEEVSWAMGRQAGAPHLCRSRI